jgi:hypothetical protein
MLRIFIAISVAVVLASSIGLAQNTSTRLKAHCPEVQWEEVAAKDSTRVLYYLCVPVTPETQKQIDALGGDNLALFQSVAKLKCKDMGYEAGRMISPFTPAFDQLPLRKNVPTVIGDEADGTIYWPFVAECLKSLKEP